MERFIIPKGRQASLAGNNESQTVIMGEMIRLSFEGLLAHDGDLRDQDGLPTVATVSELGGVFRMHWRNASDTNQASAEKEG